MFGGVRRYIWERRRGLAKIAGVVGGVYLITKYVLERLEEMREKAKQDRAAREKYASSSR
jgi:peroxin-3